MIKSVMKPSALIGACVLATSLTVGSAHGAGRTGTDTRSAIALSKSTQTTQSQRARLKGTKGVKALSPQPFPPDPSDIRRSKSNAQSLSPQPLPPGPDKSVR